MAAESGFRQDLPPSGGYRKFNYSRTFPKTFWRPGLMVASLCGATVVGYFQVKRQQQATVAVTFGDTDLRNAMQPFLLAERDRTWLKLVKKNRQLEEEIMRDVPGWVTGTWYGEPVYFTLGDKWYDISDTEGFAHSSNRVYENEHMWKHHSEYAGPKFYDNWLPKSISQYFW